jgi:hypothetical protein
MFRQNAGKHEWSRVASPPDEVAQGAQIFVSPVYVRNNNPPTQYARLQGDPLLLLLLGAEHALEDALQLGEDGGRCN